MGRVGLNSVFSLTLVDIERYVKYLTILAGASISMRIIWVRLNTNTNTLHVTGRESCCNGRMTMYVCIGLIL